MTRDETIAAIRELPDDHQVKLMNDAGFYQATDITTDDLKALAERVRKAEKARLRTIAGYTENHQEPDHDCQFDTECRNSNDYRLGHSMMLEQTDPKQDAKRFVDGMAELRRQTELRRLEEAAKQFLRDTGVGPIADHMSVHAWMAAFAYTQVHQAPDNSTKSTPIKTNVNRCEPWTHVWVKSPELPVSCDVCGISISEAVDK